MTRPRLSAVLVLAVAALGCVPRAARRVAPAPVASAASLKGARPAAQDDGSTLVCENERPTGSHILKRVCRRKDDMDRERTAAQEVLIRARGSEQRR